MYLPLRLQERLLLSCLQLTEGFSDYGSCGCSPSSSFFFPIPYLPYLVFPPGANVHPNRYFSPTGTCNLSLGWPGTLSISASSQLEVLQQVQPGIREREILCHGREKFLIHGSLFNCCHNLTSLRRTFEHHLVMRRGTGLCVSNGYM